MQMISSVPASGAVGSMEITGVVGALFRRVNELEVTELPVSVPSVGVATT
jgi:hypothetical protein